MSSERKIRASQLNGAKSHGAVTPAGRRKSSANGARHHLLSETILLENERPDAFADLFAGLTLEFNPQTETQRALVETMAVSRWRQMRIWAVERATLQSAMEAIDPDTVEPATRVARAFRSLADDSRTLDLLNRYETRFDRQFARSLNLLMKLDPLRRRGLPAAPSAEGAPVSAQEEFCQTNLSGECPDSPWTACADAEAAEAPAPHNDFCQTNLIPNPDSAEDCEQSGGQPSAQSTAKTISRVFKVEDEPAQPPDAGPTPLNSIAQARVTVIGRIPRVVGAMAAGSETAAQPSVTLCPPRPNHEQSSAVFMNLDDTWPRRKSRSACQRTALTGDDIDVAVSVDASDSGRITPIWEFHV
ncbi:MAG: hypothetical protein WBY44_11650 [Bryobacteraceae bacterium]